MHYVFITGGVSSSLGKGLASASIASLLQLRKFKVRGGTSNKVANFPIIKFPDQNKAANVRKV